MIGSRSGRWALCNQCQTYCELNTDNTCSECTLKSTGEAKKIKENQPKEED